ncbi:MAG: carbohydrate deacetylase [Bacillota bacterium]
MLLAVNADDFGFTAGVNRGILEAVRCGMVTSVSLMVNQPGTDDAIVILQRGEMSGVGVGVHLCLTKGSPVSAPAEIPSLVQQDGGFRLRQELFVQSPSWTEVERELAAQIEKVRAAGINITHLDTHHHIHFRPVILSAVISVACRYHLPVRNLDPAMRDRFRAEGVATPDYCCLHWFADLATAEVFRQLVLQGRRTGAGFMEMMTHPGLADEELRRLSGYTREREKELEVLCDPQLRQWLQENGVQLGTYEDLH